MSKFSDMYRDKLREEDLKSKDLQIAELKQERAHFYREYKSTQKQLTECLSKLPEPEEVILGNGVNELLGKRMSRPKNKQSCRKRNMRWVKAHKSHNKRKLVHVRGLCRKKHNSRE